MLTSFYKLNVIQVNCITDALVATSHAPSKVHGCRDKVVITQTDDVAMLRLLLVPSTGLYGYYCLNLMAVYRVHNV